MLWCAARIHARQEYSVTFTSQCCAVAQYEDTVQLSIGAMCGRCCGREATGIIGLCCLRAGRNAVHRRHRPCPTLRTDTRSLWLRMGWGAMSLASHLPRRCARYLPHISHLGRKDMADRSWPPRRSPFQEVVLAAIRIAIWPLWLWPRASAGHALGTLGCVHLTR